jgi:hypothetical protein
MASSPLNLRHIDPIVFSMGTDKPDVGYTETVIHRDNQAVIIPFDVENNPVIGDDAGVTINRLGVIVNIREKF